MANLNIAVTVKDNQTMSQYAMTKSGKVAFFNAGDGPLLVVTPKAGSPFCRNDGLTVIDRIEVPKDEFRKVKICDLYNSSEFLYTAQIGTALPEDPIVILERGFKLNRDISVGLGIGIVAGFVVAYALLRMRAPRPQTR
jgi:hypothetical protein